MPPRTRSLSRGQDVSSASRAHTDGTSATRRRRSWPLLRSSTSEFWSGRADSNRRPPALQTRTRRGPSTSIDAANHQVGASLSAVTCGRMPASSVGTATFLLPGAPDQFSVGSCAILSSRRPGTRRSSIKRPHPRHLPELDLVLGLLIAAKPSWPHRVPCVPFVYRILPTPCHRVDRTCHDPVSAPPGAMCRTRAVRRPRRTSRLTGMPSDLREQCGR